LPPKPHADAPRPFSGVAYSGGVIPDYGWMGDVAIDLATLKNPQGDELPILVDHDQRIDGIAGKGRLFTSIDADGLPFLAAEGELSDATEAGRKVASLFAEGFPVQLSVGMHANVRETSGLIQINGRELKVAAVFENAVVRKVSFVAVGADPDTQAHAFSPAGPSWLRCSKPWGAICPATTGPIWRFLSGQRSPAWCHRQVISAPLARCVGGEWETARLRWPSWSSPE
jgi:hypothetical protein